MQNKTSVPPLAADVILQIVELLSSGSFDAAIDKCRCSRLTSDALRECVRNYGRTLTPPPPGGALRELDAVQMRSSGHPAWSVRVPLWTREEGRSDLTLELTVSMHGGNVEVSLDDLHVL